MIEQIANHRSVRAFESREIPPQVLNEILLAATRASNTGNMQMYSIIVTTDPQIKQQLSPCHFGQPSVTQAPVVLTFCADIRRFSQWCRQRNAEPAYDNFAWFVNAGIDTLLASQNAALEAEANGLGICYLGTTIYTADKICSILNIPDGVIPITTVVVGYPANNPPIIDRLPMEAVVHRETYQDYTPEEIDQLWSERETSQETAHLLEVNNLPNLAQIFTRNRYKAEDNIAISRSYFEMLKKQGFFNQ